MLFPNGTKNVPTASDNSLVAHEKRKREAIMERKAKLAPVRRNKGKTVQPHAANPYTGKNVDGAIAHLERALSIPDAARVFGRNYWHIRITELLACPALTPTQTKRISQLAQLLASP